MDVKDELIEKMETSTEEEISSLLSEFDEIRQAVQKRRRVLRKEKRGDLPVKLTAEDVLKPKPIDKRYLDLMWPTGDHIIIDAKKKNIIVIGKGKRSVARCDVQDMFDPAVGIAVGIAMNSVKGKRSWKRLKGMLNELVEKYLEIPPVTVEDTLDALMKKHPGAMKAWLKGRGYIS